MAVAWPGTLPQGLLVGSDAFSVGSAGKTLRHTSVSGRTVSYQVSANTQRAVTGSMTMTPAQWATFETFYNTTLDGGSLPFQDLTHPVTKANVVWQFADDPTARSEPNTSHLLRVTLPLVLLPDAPA